MNNYYSDIEKLLEVTRKNERRNYAALLSAGITAQEEKLKQNKHKRGFDNIDIEYAYKRLTEEVTELDAELHGAVGLDLKAVRNEAADIANFAHMIILKCNQELSL